MKYIVKYKYNKIKFKFDSNMILSFIIILIIIYNLIYNYNILKYI